MQSVIDKIDENSQKEEFSYAYLSTLVACCGYIFQRAENPQDKQGTDIIISTPEGKNDGEIGRLTAQVKCTSQIRFDKGDCLVYPLPTKNYNELIKRSLDPRILILILVPDNVDKWIDVSSASQETLIRKCGYWKSLEGFPNTENKSTINVEIYKENILTPESLIQIIETAKQKRRELFI